MDKFLKATNKQKEQLFRETAHKRKMLPVIIEKDFWVCYVLQQLFSWQEIKSNIIFKGGTSLAKIFNVIERFSEDIDLILNWNLFIKEDAYAKRSNTQQNRRLASDKIIKENSLSKIKLLDDVVKFKIRFYPRGWAKYELAKPGTLKLLPPDYRYKALEKDYNAMKEMIYGQSPDFDQILNTVKNL